VPVAAAKQALCSHLDGLRLTDLWQEGTSGIILAVSGGPDSLALALSAAEVCAHASVNCEAVVVDHGLRTGSAAEARSVVETLKDCGLPARCFTVAGPPPTAGKQAWARDQRLQILCDHARQTSSAVLFAHHRDDQAETVMMRLMRGSGVTGLSAMAPFSQYQGVVFGRPFLGLSKAELVAVCEAYKAGFVSDPSNNDAVFERVRARQWLQSTDGQPLHPHLMRLSGVSSRLSSRLREACERWCEQHVAATFRLRAEIDAFAFSSLSPDARKQVLRRCLAFVGCQPYPVSEDAVDRLLARVTAARPSTVGGCLVTVKQDILTLMAEFGRPPAPEAVVKAGRFYSFDRRWLVFAPKDGHIRRLGSKQWAARLKDQHTFQYSISWPARMGAMIPVLHGLDGKPYHPHFTSYRGVCSAAGPINPTERHSHTDQFFVCSLPVDGPLRLDNQVKKTEKKGERA